MTHGADFSLLETMRLEGGRIPRLERHVARMAASAATFGFLWHEAPVRNAIHDVAGTHAAGRWRLRLLVDRMGTPSLACAPYEPDPRPWRVALADSPIDDRDPFILHKTTNRVIHEQARAARHDVDDVLLWNQRREITEVTIANVVFELDGVRVTPPVTSGLLAGTFRGELLDAGILREEVVTRTDLERASRIWLINSLREWIDGDLVS